MFMDIERLRLLAWYSMSTLTACGALVVNGAYHEKVEVWTANCHTAFGTEGSELETCLEEFREDVASHDRTATLFGLTGTTGMAAFALKLALRRRRDIEA